MQHRLQLLRARRSSLPHLLAAPRPQSNSTPFRCLLPNFIATRAHGTPASRIVAQKNDFGFSAPNLTSTESAARNGRSPLERFRTSPMKPLSVTDIVSPAWCEVQYWYTLTKHGRKRRTPAMKQGSKVHKKLEEQVHTTVEVLVQTREDAWGLKIWNVIQGLRTLRNTGSTREMEIWGVIDGQVINGIIDELSYTCPDEELEEAATSQQDSAPANQPGTPSILDSLQKPGTDAPESGPWLGDPYAQRKVFITDVKTRGSKTLPQSSALRPTVMQLMLYRKLLSAFASNLVDAATIFQRYNLKADAKFSNSFIAEVGGLDFNFRNDSTEDDEAPFSSQEDAVSELLAHNTLVKLWGLMIQEFTKTMPGPNAIGQVLTAEFRNQQTGDIMGTKMFSFDKEMLQEYLADEMSWWRGEREAKGVDIEEAYKCRFCEFADICEWRQGKVQEAAETHRSKAKSGSKSRK
ncbi:uncharacterized protein K452DRAFT_282199 [Aplosporella prunicola CBS 121167]|uniref:Exonuclease V, mitochondrial n=1 Tax=Aplosporella prunicola CBS 121167 TaxID=1176127 RepID=A0A6A6BSZ6_9PEZI|nr:uncharacterized protein K452DRAFT_282199 [Aplosporella prunicola CBS 121167]KAF2147216.1 hypothetical protein K452DRAFT_282199 [Aplosporella prunicola CBS 121167]